MAEISGPRIENISDLEPGSQDEPYQKPPAKAPAAAKPVPPSTPEIGAPDEEEKGKLDEMA